MKKNNAALQQGLIPGSLIHTCQRCGQSEILYSVSRFTEADYIELFHERMELERELRQARARATHWEQACLHERQALRETDKLLGRAYDDIGERAAKALKDDPGQV